MPSYLPLPALAALLLCAASAAVRAQSPAGPVLEEVSQVRALDGRDARTNQRAVRLRGVVTHVNVEKTLVTLNDGENGIGVSLDKDVPCPALADDIEIEGHTIVHVLAGRPHPRVLATALRVIGPGRLPVAKKIDIATLTKFAHFEQWVSIEGQVTTWRYRPSNQELEMVVIRGGVWTKLTLLTRTRPAFADQLAGSTLRLTGINAGRVTHDAEGAMIIPSPAQVEMLKPGWKSVFDAPEAGMNDLARGRVPMESRVKVRGIVVRYPPGSYEMMLRGADGALVIGLEAAWARGSLPGDEVVDAGQPWPLRVKTGDEVEAVVTVSPSSYRYALADVRVIGQGRPVPSETVAIETLQAFENKDDWVSVEVTVAVWAQKGNETYFHTQSASDWLYFMVPDMAFASNLCGAHVRVTGIAHRQGSKTIFYVPGPEYFEVLTPGKEDFFDFPEHPASDILHFRLPLGKPVTTKGVVVGMHDMVVLVRGEGGALAVRLMNLWGRNQGFTQIADGGEHPTLAVGDRVEISGVPVRYGRNTLWAPYDLVHAHVRVIGKSDRVEATDTTIAKVLAGDHNSDLVRVRGRLLTSQTTPLADGGWRTQLLLTADGDKITAGYDSRSFNPFNTLRPDDEVLIQCLAKKATPDTPPHLRIISPSEAKSLGLSPEVITRRLWMWGGGALAIFVLFSGWIIALRRSNRMKTEVATILEQRVDERTAELRQAQSDLKKALIQERELSELKSRFVTMVSHEFRTPLGIIMSAIELMRHYEDKLPREQLAELQTDIFSATRHMAGLMEQVLVLGRVEAGKLGCKRAPCDLNLLAGKLIDESLSASSRKGTILWHPQGSLSGAQADEGLLRHIFSNLLANAVKYSPEGSEVTFTARREGTEAVFEVTDRGIGIPENEYERLFEAFHRCSNVGDIPGTGLGLVIVKRCIDLHGGTVHIESEAGKGTTFLVRLPLFADQTAAAAPAFIVDSTAP